MLFLRPVQPSAAVATGPEQMPARATVCSCNSVSKGEIVDCFHAGARTLADVARGTRATTGCGSCTGAVCGLLDWLSANNKENADVAVG
jgi:assimilatory nitrate reductase electron transfer subunit